jgi:hypothetical protein
VATSVCIVTMSAFHCNGHEHALLLRSSDMIHKWGGGQGQMAQLSLRNFLPFSYIGY